MAASTRAADFGETLPGLLSTFETVPTDTPARSATSRMPTVLFGMPGSFRDAMRSPRPTVLPSRSAQRTLHRREPDRRRTPSAGQFQVVGSRQSQHGSAALRHLDVDV